MTRYTRRKRNRGAGVPFVYIAAFSLVYMLWLFSSVIMLAQGRADEFQRLGAIGIVAVLVSVAAIKWDISGFKFFAENERLKSILEKDVSDRSVEERVDLIESQTGDHPLYYLEIAAAILATIQWGFGDVIVHSLHGNADALL